MPAYPVKFSVWRKATPEEAREIERGNVPEGQYQFNETLQAYQVPKGQPVEGVAHVGSDG